MRHKFRSEQIFAVFTPLVDGLRAFSMRMDSHVKEALNKGINFVNLLNSHFLRFVSHVIVLGSSDDD